MEINQGKVLNTKFTPDSLQYKPSDKNYLAVGSYELDAEAQTKAGQLTIYNLKEEPSIENSFNIEKGALDLKWISDKCVIMATGTGKCEMVDIINDTSKNLQLSDGLCLSIDNSPETYYLSDSKGYLYLIDAKTFTSSSQVKGCDYEAWTIHSDIKDANIFYSGGDDCKFKMWDKRSMTQCFSKTFDMGICSVASHKSIENLVAFGSYNEVIYFWDKRVKKILNEINVGGGVWRLNWHEEFPSILSTAAMHGGCKILKYAAKPEILCSYKHHESMVYGIDINYNVVASCSFYDRSLQLWTVPENLIKESKDAVVT
ncbi:DgyrCDS6685 [Dimorphilus gyrociliatus]|uniref:methylated diphthine methylhydrolase n=1 Tax=Dimorphilus gyrociliatus TaxID=2664684 RepID=A0A7I8VNS0_9ANNE|nr:DgyrCDS6685 [Dimorphilus gyrociliatus]